MTKHKTALEKFEDFFKAFEKTYFNSENMHFNVCKFKELADAAIEEAKKDNQVGIQGRTLLPFEIKYH